MNGEKEEAVSLILAAGRGSRMKGFSGNKALLPLIPAQSPYKGSHSILFNIINSLPPGPTAIVVHHKKDDIINATKGLGIAYCVQPVLNGTGGALLAARQFIREQPHENIIITMGDVPFVKKSSFEALIETLKEDTLVVLGFRPRSKKQYGLLEIEDKKVRQIIEWKYWKEFPEERLESLTICNSGIYSARKDPLLRYLDILESHPHLVRKEIKGKIKEFEEFFITDLIGYMNADGLSVGYLNAEDEAEVMGIDDPDALKKAQALFTLQSS